MIRISENIFVILDNLSVHKSKKVQKEIAKHCPRIKFVFLTGKISRIKSD